MNDMSSCSMAQKWAEFSGDFNPIHFDLEAARQVGADQLLVHGMQALLHVKQHVSNHASETNQPANWQQFKALFRSPVLQETSFDIVLSKKSDAINFVLNSEGESCFRGSQVEVAAPDFISINDASVITIPAEKVQQQFHLFQSYFPFVTDAWIFVDALIFSEFLRAHFAKLEQLPKKSFAVQMSHRVIFNAERINALFSSADQFYPLTYTVTGTESSVQSTSEFGVANLNVTANGCLMMQIEIGLLAKFVDAKDNPVANHNLSPTTLKEPHHAY